MSILIHGMDMPKGNSTINLLIYSDGRIFTGLPKDSNYSAEKWKKGTWIDQKGGGCCCSECGRYALEAPDGDFIHVSVKSNYCPHCGSYNGG